MSDIVMKIHGTPHNRFEGEPCPDSTQLIFNPQAQELMNLFAKAGWSDVKIVLSAVVPESEFRGQGTYAWEFTYKDNNNG